MGLANVSKSTIVRNLREKATFLGEEKSHFSVLVRCSSGGSGVVPVLRGILSVLRGFLEGYFFGIEGYFFGLEGYFVWLEGFCA